MRSVSVELSCKAGSPGINCRGFRFGNAYRRAFAAMQSLISRNRLLAIETRRQFGPCVHPVRQDQTPTSQLTGFP